MRHVVRVYVSSTSGTPFDVRAYEAEFGAGKWTWDETIPKGKLKSVQRVEVYRPGETEPCLAINTDGSKTNVVDFDGSRVLLQLRLISPAFSKSEFSKNVKGAAEFVAETDPARVATIASPGIVSELLWKQFTCTDAPLTLASSLPLSGLASRSAIQELGAEFAGYMLLNQLVFGDKNALLKEVTDFNVALLLRCVESHGQGERFLVGFSPRTKYGTRFSVAGQSLVSKATWIEWVQPAEDLKQWDPGSERVSPLHFLLWIHGLEGSETVWNAAVAKPYAAALLAVAAGEDATFLPELLKVDAGGLSFCFRYQFKNWDRLEVEGRTLLRVEPFMAGGAKVGLRLSGIPLLDSAHDRLAYEGVMGEGAEANVDKDASELHFGWLPRDEEGVTRLRLCVLKGVATTPATGRMRFGSLDLSVGKGDPLPAIEAVARITNVGLELGPAHVVRGIQTRVSGAMLSDVVPGAEDPVPDSTRASLDESLRTEPSELAIRAALRAPAAIIIPVGAKAKAPALLEVQEQSSTTASRSMVLRLRKVGTQADAERTVVYLSTEPFFLAKVRIPGFSPVGIESDEIANWSLSERDGRKWELASARSGFRMLLPPQAVGEAMEKSRDQPSLAADKPADYRFSAPAMFDLESSWFKQGYAEAPWNLSRVLGYVGQRAPGAPVNQLMFELVYGMTTVLDAKRFPARLSLAEMGSRIGDLAPRLERAVLEDKGYADARREVFLHYRSGWAQLLRLYRARLAVLELYAPGAREELELGVAPPLMLQDGVTTYLRRGQHEDTTTPPPRPVDDEGADLRYPIKPSRRPPGNYYEQGLAGGYSWPFESDAVFRNLIRTPVSDQANVSNVRFSSLGAWGEQRAAFDNKRTRIITNTAMGRLARITVERVGRIGVLWNRSKHVIVYERTVLATPQFKPYQTEHKGRAVLRKVEEYVEILEAERRYPEFGALPKSRGFVEASHFASRRIPVHSDWGVDTPHGVEIPLWLPSADPRVYPRPSVFLATTGENAAVQVSREISEPDRLYFFSATDAGLDDRTDLWPAFADVDYGNEPLPQADSLSALDPANPDAMLPDALADPPGWRRFTWPLVDTAATSNLVSARTTEAALMARLTHLSMMRASPNVSQSELGGAMGSLDATRALLRQLQQNSSAAALAQMPVDALRAQLLAHLGATARALTSSGSPGAASDTLKRELPDPQGSKKASETLEAQLRSDVARQSDSIALRVGDWVKARAEEISKIGVPLTQPQVSELAADWSAEARALFTPFSSVLENVERSIATTVAQFTSHYLEALDTFDEVTLEVRETGGVPWEVAEAINGVRTEILAALGRLGAILPMEAPALLQGALANVRGAIAAVTNAVNKAADQCLGQINADEKWLDPDPSMFEALRAAVFGDLDEPLASGESTLATPIKWLRKAQEALTHGLSQLPKPAKAINDFLEEKLKILQAGTGKQIADALQKIEGETLSELKGQVDAVRAKVAAAAADLTAGALGWQSTLDDLAKGWTDLKSRLETWQSDLRSQGEDQVKKWAQQHLAEQLNGAYTGIDNLYGRARALQQDWGKVPSFQDASTTLRLIQAVGEGPLLPEMTFNRERIAYFFDDYAAAVRTSPVAALVNRVGDDLKALGVRLPTTALLDRIIPEQLQNFDLGQVLPDFAALKNSALFKNLKLPVIANDTVKVTHGFDDVNRVPWLKARIDIPLSGRSEAFRLGPLALVLPKGDLHAHALLEGSKRSQGATITADWQLEFGGAPLVTFEDTLLEFTEGGSMRFEIRPDRIRMDAALQWLTDLTKSFTDNDNGLQLETQYEDGRPVGVACRFAVAMPPLGGGAFAVSGIQLGAGLTLGTDRASGEFAVGVSFNVSRKIAPFTLTIAFLNGGGWIESNARYLTKSQRVVSTVTIGIVAGAGAEFALGPCAGSVYVQFGMFVEFSSGGPDGQRLSIGIMLLIRGSVVVFAIATVTVTLLLQAVYREDGSLTGYGSLSVSIRVSFFVKLRFSSQVTYNLSGNGGARSRVASALSAAPANQVGAQASAASRRQIQRFK